MINLLPQVQQKEIRAGYSNTLLLRYIILLICALAFLGISIGITYISLNQAAQQADTTKRENEEKATNYLETQAAVAKLQSDLASAKSLFDNEVSYSKVITRLSSLFPSGTAVDSLQFDSGSFSQPMTLSVQVRDQAAAEALQQNFSSSPYVSGASLGKISTNNSSRYPYTVELLFTLNKAIGQ